MSWKFLYCLLVLCEFCFIMNTNGEINDLILLNRTSCFNNEYFDSNLFKCVKCDPKQHLIPSNEKMACLCNNQSIIISWKKDGDPFCKLCQKNEVPTSDKRACIRCQRNTSSNDIKCSKCDANSVIVERSTNGSLLSEITCAPCLRGLIPDEKKKNCIMCPISMPNCTCSPDTHEFIPEIGCYLKNIISPLAKSYNIYEISYNLENIRSKLLYERLLISNYNCKMNDSVMCQSLSNMCVLNLYQDSSGGPCKLYKDTYKFNSLGLPWLYYPEGDAWNTLSKKTINKRFTLDSTSEESHLIILVNKWYLNGSWSGQEPGLKSLSLCPLEKFPERIRFASEYSVVCFMSAKELMKSKEPLFFDIYLKYNISNETMLHSIPVLIQNYKQHKKFVNKVNDISQWQLTRRYFIIDGVSSYKLGDNISSLPNVIRYLKSATLRIRARDGQEEGMIYPPLLILSYGEMSKEDIEKNLNLKLSLNVEFQKNDYAKYDFDVSLTILCSLSALWSILRAWSHTKRSGQRAIDLVAVLHLCIIACGHLANVFFLISSCAAIHNFVYYKWQIVAHVLLPSSSLTYLVRTYIIVSFPLKVVEILYMIWNHLNIDIFLIDWEQPRIQKQQIFSVSAWRTYFVSNKWNEIQTERRTNVVLQLGFTILFLKVWGIENWSVSVPELHTNIPTTLEGYVKFNKIHRLAVGVMVFCVIYMIQCAFILGVYERYIKNPIQEFVDICSLANISVFILSLENFGFYIHGRSVHGFSDTDMATLKHQLQREEEDLVGHRGLLPASDRQTFKMIIPPKLRLIYRSLLSLSPNVSNHFHISGFMKEEKGQLSNTDFGMQSYVTINRFLAAFIEHALKDLDYEIREKSFVEALLDIELCDVINNGTLYNDNGHSFDNVLYYGNEFKLFTFDLVVFSFVEILWQDFLLAALITVLFDQFLARIRRYGGRKNFSRKTLIDEKFLL